MSIIILANLKGTVCECDLFVVIYPQQDFRSLQQVAPSLSSSTVPGVTYVSVLAWARLSPAELLTGFVRAVEHHAATDD
jgi:hypothetical protein